jgi:hypothetical protein
MPTETPTMCDAIQAATGAPVGWQANNPKTGDEMIPTIRKASASDCEGFLKEDGGTLRGQSHGPAGAHIGNIAGCISMKRRQGSVHYGIAVKVSECDSEGAGINRKVFVSAEGRKGAYAVICMAHGVSRPVPSRKAAMHSVRTAGKQPTEGVAFAKGAIAEWCNQCVKGQQSVEDSQ